MLLITAMIFMLSVIVTGLLCDQMSRVRKNITTVEYLSEASSQYDLGAKANLEQVLGTGCCRRWWPRASELTGFEWESPEYRGASFDPLSIL
jgi:hypothetical protein